MPIYEYTCKSCGNHFECMQKISAPPIAPCPRCGDTADRIISMTAFTLKGEGWYKDGYAKGKKAESTKVKSESSKAKDKT
ncbi:MAG: zinc ribbon domain-containing protein [Proteobacteria bacterium]|nr:zinc ribbon domain-containing protein [Pseudomonadota bacterium]